MTILKNQYKQFYFNDWEIFTASSRKRLLWWNCISHSAQGLSGLGQLIETPKCSLFPVQCMEMIRGCEWLIFPSSGDWEAGDHNSDFNNDKKLSRFTCSMLGKLLFWEKGMSWSNTLQAALLTSWEQVEGITFCTRSFFFFFKLPILLHVIYKSYQNSWLIDIF